MSDRLKPCPIPKCGCIPKIRMRHPYKQDENPIFYLLCDKCLFSSEHLKPNGFKSIKSAANWWNTRPDQFKNVRELLKRINNNTYFAENKDIFSKEKVDEMIGDILDAIGKDIEDFDNADN